MHAIVLGSGRVGSRPATYLSMEGHDVVVVGRDVQSFERLASMLTWISTPRPSASCSLTGQALGVLLGGEAWT